VSLPNFICPGAQKAGTTSLHNILIQHPDIYLPDEKETKFFQNDELYCEGIGFYERTFFSNWSGQKAVGEIDPSYLFFEYVPARIRKDLGKDIKLLFMLRDPVKRALSQYYQALRVGSERESFERAVMDADSDRQDTPLSIIRRRYITRGFYATQIKRYLEFFPKENMLFIIFETDFLNNREETIGHVLDFLDVKRMPLDIDIKSNPASVSRSQGIKRLMHMRNAFRETAKALVPSKRLRKDISSLITKLNDKKVEKMNLDPVLRMRLLDRYYIDEIKDLERLLGRDLSIWYQF
jgi:hypothetical protein